MASSGSREVKVLLIGKTGVGKSSLGNFLTNKSKFKVAPSFAGVTGDPDKESCIVDIDGDQFIMYVIDTPGLADAAQEDDEEGLEKICKGAELVATDGSNANLHAIMFVISAKGRFTRDDAVIVQYFAEEGSNFWSHAILVITSACEYGETRDDQLKTFNESLQNPRCPKGLKTVVDETKNRYILVDSLHSTSEVRDELLRMVKQLSLHHDGGYIHGALQRCRDSFDKNSDNPVQAKEEVKTIVKSEVEEQKKKKGKSCFPGESTVITKDGTKFMNEIKPGDKVLSITPHGSTIFSEVVTFLHYEPKTIATYMAIQTKSGALLHVSGNHLVFSVTQDKAKLKFKAVIASCLQPGDYILGINSSSSQVQSTQVANITVVHKQGVYAPMTQCGTIVVDSSVASCYASYPSHTIAHVVMAPLRIYYTIKQHHREKPIKEGVNSYASLLYKLVY